MDLSLWEPSYVESNYHVGDDDNLSHNTCFSPGSGVCDTKDHRMCSFSYVYGRDVMEEDSLNEKSCVQVLRKMIDRADEEIMKLEEDTVMLRCRIAWDDVYWSRPCTFALTRQINRLNILIHSLKKNEITQDTRRLGEECDTLAPRLHDLLKPLLENYLSRKSKKTGNSVIRMPAVLPADGVSGKNIESSTSGDDEKVEQPADEILTMDCEERIARASVKRRKARTYNGARVSEKPLVKIEKKSKESPKKTEELYDHRTKHASRANMNSDHKIQVQQRREIKTFKIKAEEVDTDSSSVENLNGQKRNGAPRKMIEIEPRLVLNGESEDLSLRIRDVERLKLIDLRIIAKNRKLRGYSRLRKKELQERLGSEGPVDSQKKWNEKKGGSSANTI